MTGEKLRESMAFGKAVRLARKSMGISQDSFADLSGLHRTYIGAIERGEKNPTLNSIFRLATALQIPPHKLIEKTLSMLEEGTGD